MTQTTLTSTREDAYRLLSACYYPPTAALLEEGCCTALAQVLSNVSNEAADRAAEAARVLVETSLESQLVEYSRLFLGPFKLVAPPYGSVWLDKQKTVMGDSTARVAEFYHAQGLQLADEFPELPDHIAVELEFLSYLAFKEREAGSCGDSAAIGRLRQAQLDFINTFLLPWLLPFTEAIIEDGEAPFYQAIAACTAAFVTADVINLQEDARA